MENFLGEISVPATGIEEQFAGMSLASELDNKEFITSKDYHRTCPPMTQLSHELVPHSVKHLKKLPKIFYGFLMTPRQLMDCAKRLGVFPPDHIPDADDFGSSIQGIVDKLFDKDDRLLTACMPKLQKTAGVIGLFNNRTMPWYFWGYERDTRMLEQLREDLGLPPNARPLWWHAVVDLDLQEMLDKPSIAYVRRMKGKTKRASSSQSQEPAKKQRCVAEERHSSAESSDDQ